MPAIRVVVTLNVTQLFLHYHDDTHDGTETSCFEFLDVCSIDAFSLQLVDFSVVLFDLLFCQ